MWHIAVLLTVAWALTVAVTVHLADRPHTTPAAPAVGHTMPAWATPDAATARKAATAPTCAYCRTAGHQCVPTVPTAMVPADPDPGATYHGHYQVTTDPAGTVAVAAVWQGPSGAWHAQAYPAGAVYTSGPVATHGARPAAVAALLSGL